jgi:serine/threonine-protein kinase
MSPEQIDARTIDARSDIYALGLLLYECLAGVPPFRSPSARELLNMQCTAPAPELPEEVRATVPAGVEQLLFRTLEKSPDARPASAAEVVAGLAPFVPSSRPPRSSRSVAVGGATRNTLASTPAPPLPKRADTVELMARAAQPRTMSNVVAVMLIVVLSLLAGATAYVLRLRTSGAEASAEPAAPGQATSAPRR